MAHVWVVEERIGKRWKRDHFANHTRGGARRRARLLRLSDGAYAPRGDGATAYATRVRKYVREEA